MTVDDELSDDDIIRIAESFYVKYSNILKNSYKKDPWNLFTIKRFDRDGKFKGSYSQVEESFFRERKILPYTKKFNPEKLI